MEWPIVVPALVVAVPLAAMWNRNRTAWLLGTRGVDALARIIRLDAGGPRMNGSGFGTAQVDIEIPMPDGPALPATLYLGTRTLLAAGVEPGWLLPVRYVPRRPGRDPLVVPIGSAAPPR